MAQHVSFCRWFVGRSELRIECVFYRFCLCGFDIVVIENRIEDVKAILSFRRLYVDYLKTGLICNLVSCEISKIPDSIYDQVDT